MLAIIKLGNAIHQNIEPFYVEENNKKVWNIPNNVADLKTAMIDTVKWQSGHKLKDTDWAVVKCTELSLNISEKYPEIYNERTIIREWSNTKEEEIAACTTIDELIALDIKL